MKSVALWRASEMQIDEFYKLLRDDVAAKRLKESEDKASISMRIDRLKIRGFKNLDNVDIDFDQKSLETVLIGQNGSGKSNVIEALATIFRDLDYPRRDSDFDYHIAYDCKDHRIEIDQGYSKPGDTVVTIDGAAQHPRKAPWRQWSLSAKSRVWILFRPFGKAGAHLRSAPEALLRDGD